VSDGPPDPSPVPSEPGSTPSPSVDGNARAARSGSGPAQRWALPVGWALLPLLMGPSLQAALDPRAHLFRSWVSAGLWLGWAVVLTATLIPRTVTLTGVRMVIPAAVLAGVWAAAATAHPGARDVVSVVWIALVAALAFAPFVGEVFVNGSAYGLERRLPLRAPGPLLLGPVELTWAAAVVGAVAGPLLLADRRWLAGGLALVIGWPVTWWAARSLHGLSRRWLVFTPAGLVLHDPLAAVESILVIRRHLASLGPALADSSARDLTLGAFGLALEVRLTEALPISPAPRRRLRAHDEVTTEEIDGFLFTPTRPGVVLTEAARRRLPTG
jgi:hypothetical protein